MEETVLNAVVEGYLTAKRVRDIFEDCLFKDHEIVNGKPIVDPLIVQGIIRKFGFHPERINKHRIEIEKLYLNLPEKCSEGISFLCLCYDKYNHIWTGSHQHMEQLVSLGLATGIAEYCAPKEMWSVLPGGVPYIVMHLDRFQHLEEAKEKVKLKVSEQDIEVLKKIWDTEIVNAMKPVQVITTKKEVCDAMDKALSVVMDEKIKPKRVSKGKLCITKYAKPRAYVSQKVEKPKDLPVKLTKISKVAKVAKKKASILDVKKTKVKATTKAKVKANVKTKKRK